MSEQTQTWFYDRRGKYYSRRVISSFYYNRKLLNNPTELVGVAISLISFISDYFPFDFMDSEGTHFLNVFLF